MTSYSISRRRSKRGYTLTEIIVVVTLIGILVGIGYSLLTKTTATGLQNALARNAAELNHCMENLQAANATYAAGASAVVQGTATSGAAITNPSPATPAAVQALVSILNSPGISSYGSQQALSKSITAASYTYTLDATNKPVFTVVAGATQP